MKLRHSIVWPAILLGVVVLVISSLWIIHFREKTRIDLVSGGLIEICLAVGDRYRVPIPLGTEFVRSENEEIARDYFSATVVLRLTGSAEIDVHEYLSRLTDNGWHAEEAVGTITAHSVLQKGGFLMISKQPSNWSMQVSCFADK